MTWSATTSVGPTPTANRRPITGGKGIRPALAVLSAEAAWADAEVGAPGGVAVELVHNFSLIHDDLMDGDLERRHRPTVWALWGPVVAHPGRRRFGQRWPPRCCSAATNPARPAAATALGEATAEMIAGQADDLAFEKRQSSASKNAWPCRRPKPAPCSGAPPLSGPSWPAPRPTTVQALRDFGRHLGVAFQAVDDLLGIWGDPATTGKPAGNDIRARKKSMPIVAALAAGDDEPHELRELLFGDLEVEAPPSAPGVTGQRAPVPRWTRWRGPIGRRWCPRS